MQKAADFYQLIRHSYASGMTSFGSQPHNIRANFPLIEQAHRRLAKVVVENKDFEKLIGQYDRPVSFFYADPPYYETKRYSLGELFKQRPRAVLCKAYQKGSHTNKMVWLPLFSGLERLALVVSKNTLIRKAPILFGLVRIKRIKSAR